MNPMKIVRAIVLHLLLFVVDVSAVLLPTDVFAGPGDLDTSFGPIRGFGGVRTFQMPKSFKPCCMTQQADGKLLVAGYTFDGFDVPPNLILRRHRITDGALDSTFGLGGEAIATVPFPVAFVYGKPFEIDVQPDGKILVSGQLPDGRPVIWRFTTAGQLDMLFGDEGVQILSNDDGSAKSIKFRNGKIFVVSCLTSNDCFLLRRTISGSPDVTFGLIGSVVFETGFEAEKLVVNQTDGSMYIGGRTSQGAAVFRYFANGSPDTAFGVGGRIHLPFLVCEESGTNSVSDFEIQPDGKLVTAGNTVSYGGAAVANPYIHRYSASGLIDIAFGGTGSICLEPWTFVMGGTGYKGNQTHVARQADGKLVTLAYDSSYPSLKRLNVDGSVDTFFDPSFTTGHHAFDVLVQNADGKIVIFGLTPPESLWPKSYRLIRYLP